MLPSIFKKKIRKHIEKNGLTNSVGFVPTFNIDANKTTMYPFTNVDIISCEPVENVFNYSIVVTSLGKRQNDGKLTYDTKTEFENMDDNINDNFVIINKFLDFLKMSSDMSIVQQSEITFLRKNYTALLDGCRIELTIQVDNELDCLV